ncbi:MULTISPECIES: hypothetical protein [unclassified Pseudonocardia]|uniref:hypothetical protein n=1 Tax=unclassified Pseudonocardia TaxID=2619320 RepID=UPI00094B183F|nr:MULTISPECIES: hypothetical protein [unclassified Pseudonocardia]
MARKKSILDSLTEEDQGESPETKAEPPAVEPKAEEGPEQRPKGRSTTRRTPAARKATRRPGPTRSAEKTEPQAEEKPAQAEGPKVLKPPSTAEAARISLYLHKDDKRLLRARTVDDDLDDNSRFRAFMALYRYDQRLAKRVDDLALKYRNA